MQSIVCFYKNMFRSGLNSRISLILVGFEGFFLVLFGFVTVKELREMGIQLFESRCVDLFGFL